MKYGFLNYFTYSVLILIAALSSSKNTDEEPKIETFKCESSNPSPKGERLIGIDLLDRSETNTFDDNLVLGSELGIQFIALHLN